ncbi:MAG: YqjF family protein [Pyrinomonadaceae bacterium]
MTKANAQDNEQPGDDKKTGRAKKTTGGTKKAAAKKSASRKASASAGSKSRKSTNRKSAGGNNAGAAKAGAKRTIKRQKVIIDGIDRESPRRRPEGMPLMEHHWGKLLFMHWPVTPESLRPFVPERLMIDTFDGEAWLGVTPFSMWGVRLSFAPPVPYLSEFHELNVRTYVLYDGVPGVWFFSLNTNSSMTVLGARTFYFLPYFNSSIDLRQETDTIHYALRRTDAARPADFNATWKIGKELPEAVPGTLEHFLTERYCLYSASGESIYRARIHHQPWPLRQATLISHRSNIIESDFLPKPQGEPLVHYAEAIAVDVWPPEKA